jgi:nitrite reductase/ring-hydroxylating ferredoxin subunit
MTNLSRRQALGGAATVGVGVPLLAACGAGGSSGAGGTGGGGVAPTPKAGTGLVAASDVPVGSAVILSDAHLIVTQPKAGEFKAFSNICTHAGCPISQVSGSDVVCPCHGSRFNIATGAPEPGSPATRNLPEVTVKLQGSQVVKS